MKTNYRITGIAQMQGLGRNGTVEFDIYDRYPPAVGSHYYSRELGVGVHVLRVDFV